MLLPWVKVNKEKQPIKRCEIMTQPTKSLKLRGSIHDVQYLFAGIRALLLLKTPAGKETFIASVRKEISDYNRQLADRYTLGKPRSIGSLLAYDVIADLKALGVVELVNNKWDFSLVGKHLVSLLENSRTKEFRNEITKLMVSRFPQLASFLMALYELTTSEELVLPRVTAELFNYVSARNMRVMANSIVGVASTNLSEDSKLKLSAFELEKRLNMAFEKAKGDKIRSLGVEADQYLVSRLFGPNINSKRTYDIVRDLCTSLFLVNYGYFKKGDMYSEIVYLTSWLYPSMRTPSDIHGFNEINLEDGRRILIHDPFGEAFKTKFAEAVKRAYATQPHEFGFVRISNLRNQVCKDLRISDRLFDSEIVEIYEENPQKFSLSYSFEKVTSKRLPILIGDTLKTMYNLISIKE
jgi:hypothetical protein